MCLPALFSASISNKRSHEYDTYCVVLSKSCVFFKHLAVFLFFSVVGLSRAVKRERTRSDAEGYYSNALTKDEMKCKVIITQMNSFCLLGPVI